MILSAHEITFLQRLIAARPATRKAGPLSLTIATYGVGRASGRSIHYGPSDWETAAKLLENRGIPLSRPDGEMRRAETVEYAGVSEKAFGSRPHSNSVALRTAHGDCDLDGAGLKAPGGGYMVLTTEDAMRVRCDRILLVENLETFRHLHRYEWITYGRGSTLAIFRGDPTFSLADAAKVLAARGEPVDAFVDFDPAGLSIAASLPRLAHLILPDERWLISAIRGRKRYDLYDDQIGVSGAKLAASTHPDIVRSFALLKEFRQGYCQEWMESAPTSPTL
ncbi:DUF7281 domain-containing protein [Cupriavidus pinatubonensis]|uniref:DUF7281 domain-containing protein n=1 Tax=Cupriavidus pinatubonensis TaxID=248026 RepID=A0ABM8WDN9_9BURK|nr:hypothetical protein [Cupriavidus pinatubonensis]CAG9165412.1 hypothetical protein LMG23994_00689 [Cupriavidus pinatubonensis]